VTQRLSLSTSTDRRFYGVAEAIVAKVNDPDQQGRIRVRFPWFDPNELSDWIRIAQPYAGSGHGSTWIPEEGSEVLVGFVHGDMRIPMVLGCLYNGADKPPSARTKERDQKMFRTKAGHQVLLDDSARSLGIEVTTKAGHKLKLDDIRNEITLGIADGPSIVLSKDGGQMHLKATSITIEADSITINASGGLTAKGKPIRLN
jgi:uncharacterized protein involved in type VI secretion and phage assembly